ncbi:efflux RND transporter periplasmic adaptor subunit [Helicobacter mesocricetorum]|uniref:efflux RND transporter periplasmic adaptor subunit n=1 Tax=Helicobacter mesocricetorum TaxID=87012 RepID=UPI000CF0ACFC|nr:efflux RND transporter periplasmic adaptor subunit [Helicobacter mesocricetorum]
MISSQNILQNLNPKKSYKKLFLLSISAVLILLFLIGGIYYWSNKAPIITYQTKEVFIGDISSTINANGTLSPTNEVSIGSVISGIVLEVFVDVNDRVSKGEVLAKIDSESIEQNLYRFKAQLESAKAQLKSSQVALEEKQWQYQQLQNLYEKTQGKTPSVLELQSAKTSYNAALSDIEIKKATIKEIETSIRSTQVDLKNSQITSPIDGIILKRSIEVGQSVAASFQAPEFFIVAESLEEMELNASVSEADIGKVQVGQKVKFSVDSYPSKTFEEKINRVNYGSNSTNSSTSSNAVVSYEVKIYVHNKDLLLRPGMSATADIEVANAQNVLLVPSSALYFTPKSTAQTQKKNPFNPLSGIKKRPNSQKTTTNQGKTLWVLENNSPKQIEVEVGISNGEYTQISSELIQPGTQVIIGQQGN